MKIILSALLLTAGWAYSQNYQNYDFVPGNNLVFADDFQSDAVGEWPSHWNLQRGQGAVGELDGERALVMTESFSMAPLMKTENYLSNNFSIEFDAVMHEEWNSLPLTLAFLQEEGYGFYIRIGFDQIGFATDTEKDMVAKMTTESGKKYHFALSYIDKQMKVYVDEKRIIAIPNTDVVPNFFWIQGAVYEETAKRVIQNFRFAEGAQMNMWNSLSTDGKFISYGITFDVGKATIKPESMGTINQIVKLLNENPDLKLEISGHTDSDGSDETNLTLSQQRAEAVVNKLVELGIDRSRLTAVGYGESKPIIDNSTFENKAKNRRVEFRKI